MKHDNFLLRTHSFANSYFFAFRQYLAFSRAGYKEKPTTPETLENWLQRFSPQSRINFSRVIDTYCARKRMPFLSSASFQLHVSTLVILEELELQRWISPSPKMLRCIDAGCQGFARAPALFDYLLHHKHTLRLTGIEVDAFPLLSNLHSRYDIGRYFSQLLPGARYVATDFFQWQDSFDLLFGFFPFVSLEPTLAWGIPKNFGNADLWLQSIVKNTTTNGVILIAHQGDWEEEIFDRARKNLAAKSLALVNRKKITKLYPHYPYPVHASVYCKR